MNVAKTSNELYQLGSKIAQIYTRRFLAAQKNFISSFQAAEKNLSSPTCGMQEDLWLGWVS